MRQSEWTVASFGSCADFQEGYVNPAQSVTAYFDGPISWLRAVDLNDGFVNETSRTLSVEGFKSAGKAATLFPAGTLAISKSGTIGRIGILQREMCGNRAVINVRPRPDRLDVRFAFYSMLLGRPQIERLAEGSVQKNLYVSALSKFSLFLPPLPEQRAIAATLGALDDKIELNRKMNATLEAMARALFRDWFVDFGPTRARMEGRAPYLSPDLWPLFPDRLDAEGKPEGWEAGNMSDLFTLQRGFDLPSQDRRDGKYPILAASGPSGYHESHMVKGPGVTTGRSGVLGRVFYVHGDFWPLNTSLWVKDYKRATPLYAYQFLSLIDLAGFNAGSAVPTLNRNHVHGLPAVLPPRDLVAAFDQLADGLMSRHRHNEVENETLAQTRDLLLPRLMSGELRVAEAGRAMEAAL
jgi:type I restriction enzyme S subunit